MEHRYSIKPMMERTTTPKYFNDQVITGNNKGYTDFLIDFSDSSGTYPNICVPVAATVDYYREKRNFSFSYQNVENTYLYHTQCHAPKIVEDCIGTIELNYPFDKVWRFSSSEGVYALVSAFILRIRESDVIEQGIYSGIEWCINETMDNVLQHSKAPHGFIMGQLQRENKKLLICIFDWGIGIFNSLRPSKHNPATPLDAITLAVQERVTRDENIGQGNGMWGLSEIIKENKGFVRISSAGASYSYNNGQANTIVSGYMNFGRQNGSTLVDFQLDYSRPIDIGKALGGYKPLDMWLEDRELENGEYKVLVSDLAHGTGTRQSAAKLRNLILNIYSEVRQRIIIDFSGVNLISSSFADELIGKIISNYGFMFFNRIFQIEGVSGTHNEMIINRSVEQRMAQKYYEPDMVEPSE